MRMQRVWGALCLAAVSAVLLCMSAVSAHGESDKLVVRVMTRNVDAGTDFNYFAGVETEKAFQDAVLATIGEVLQSRIPERAHLLAAEIASAKPDLIALQEVTTWEFAGGPRLDQLELLMEALRAARQSYRVAVVQKLSELEVPDAVTFIDHDVILIRADLPPGHLEVLGTETHRYDTLMDFPLPGGAMPILRGWIAADGKIRGARFKFVTTHLESAVAGIPDTADLQLAQARQLVRSLAKTDLPVILAGDFNSDAEHTNNYPADNTDTAGYIAGSAYSDSWQTLHRCCPGYTWLLFWEDTLTGTAVQPLERIDLIFSRGPEVSSVERTGLNPDQSGLYASDHAGVVATFVLSNSRPDNPKK